ncbi:MAG: (2Fe-2S)-binding protein [Arenicellales bacterium]|jgi:carbon-monoxide dehydrogenase small subunit|nr:ferredoxin [Acidiferrobacteraceae bacterium]MDP6123776.1 (2Fe-2S)-binding protein [Arenicellales bacterium]MBT57918.1 ferredoxin [Acidiferrobacteraceae bacterium]MDP6289410.1 (2Fe-2S)-binding protein [Arenicellales bacterium]MDP6434932.1 (2Fe-2S)-binding protein [Arenicellales bacterium]|tara:strand:- start:3987 stop:4466 length:480 start_codon:yes stop_codon:yes gene_type:complete
MSLTHEIKFTLNGSPVSLTIPLTMSVLTMLRDLLNLTGTKYGCGEGECGACTILIDGVSVNACLKFAVDCDGRTLTTVEGLVADSRNDPLRTAFAEKGGVQCGFCTPGMVMQARHILDNYPRANESQIKRGIEGNLCRCTGYKKIIETIASVGELDNKG